MIFQYTRQMLHYVASSDYKAGELYETKNKREYVLNDMFYRDNVLIGYIDRGCENITVREAYYRYRGGLTAYNYATDAFVDAFKHYSITVLTAFDILEAETIFEKALIDCSGRITAKRAGEFVLAYDTLFTLGSPLYAKHAELYKKCKKIFEDDKAKKEAKRIERELKEKEYRDKCYQVAVSFLPKSIKYYKHVQEVLERFDIKRCYWDCYHKPLEATEWNMLRDLEESSPTYQPYFNFDKRYGISSSYTMPENPEIKIQNATLARYCAEMLGIYDYKNPTDFVYITDEGDLHTTRGVTVEDRKNLVKKLLKRFLQSKDKKKFVGTHVGAYEIREWNPIEQYLQVGCHRFHIKTLEDLFNTCEERNI